MRSHLSPRDKQSYQQMWLPQKKRKGGRQHEERLQSLTQISIGASRIFFFFIALVGSRNLTFSFKKCGCIRSRWNIQSGPGRSLWVHVGDCPGKNCTVTLRHLNVLHIVSRKHKVSSHLFFCDIIKLTWATRFSSSGKKDPAVLVDLRACDVLISACMLADGDDGFGTSQGIYQAPVKWCHGDTTVTWWLMVYKWNGQEEGRPAGGGSRWGSTQTQQRRWDQQTQSWEEGSMDKYFVTLVTE